MPRSPRIATGDSPPAGTGRARAIRVPHRPRRTLGVLLVASLGPVGALLAPAVATAVSVVPTRFADEAVAQDLWAPTSLAILPDGRILVTEQLTGRIMLVPNGPTRAPSQGLAKLDSISTAGYERGLLGIAVDSAWPVRPYVYVLYDCTSAPALRLSRFTVAGDLTGTGDRQLSINLATRYDLLVDLPDQSVSHNGGTLRFGRDGMLLVSLGDDFSDCQAQDLTVLVGKVLRLDVSRLPAGAGGPAPLSLLTPADNPFVANPDPRARLVWAYGMRNPFRLQVDSVTGAVFIADVGAGTYEEIERQTQGGANLGWPYYEGPAPYESCTGAPGPLTAPVYVYDRSQIASSASLALTVYHVRAGAQRGFPPECDGSFFLADYEQGFVRRLVSQGSTWAPGPMPGQPDDLNFGTGFQTVTDGAEGPDGELYYLRQSPLGEVRRIWYDYGPVSVDPDPGPQARLEEPFPMPAHGTIRFAFELPGPRVVTLELLDLQGRRLEPLLRSATMEPGRHEVRWDGRWTDGSSAAPGVYFARLSTGGRSQVRRFVWIR